MMDPFFFQEEIYGRIVFYLPPLDTLSLIAGITRDGLSREMATKCVKREQESRKIYSTSKRPRTTSGYIVFGRYWRQYRNTAHFVGKDAMRVITIEWRQLSDLEKSKYELEAHKQNQLIRDKFIKEYPNADWTYNYQQLQEKK